MAVRNADPGIVLCYGRACIVDEETGEHRPYEDEIPAADPRPSERFKTVFRPLVLTGEASRI